MGLQHKESVRGQAFQCSYDKQFRFVGFCFFFLTPELNEASMQQINLHNIWHRLEASTTQKADVLADLLSKISKPFLN